MSVFYVQDIDVQNSSIRRKLIAEICKLPQTTIRCQLMPVFVPNPEVDRDRTIAFGEVPLYLSIIQFYSLFLCNERSNTSERRLTMHRRYLLICVGASFGLSME
jgi:hypothetical protein